MPKSNKKDKPKLKPSKPMPIPTTVPPSKPKKAWF